MEGRGRGIGLPSHRGVNGNNHPFCVVHKPKRKKEKIRPYKSVSIWNKDLIIFLWDKDLIFRGVYMVSFVL